jgi:pimeloyl-ACP methyl ester carboxylesterase
MAVNSRRRIGRFTGEQARERFLRAYDVAMRTWPEPRRELVVETDFGTVHVHHHGPTTGAPIVLLHGASGNSSNWYPQIATLGARHPVYAIDTIDDPGRSVAQRVVDGSVENAAWLGEVLAGLGLDDVHLVGLSYGGWLALNQAVYEPERLATVTVLDPAGLQKVPVRSSSTCCSVPPRRWRRPGCGAGSPVCWPTTRWSSPPNSWPRS